MTIRTLISTLSLTCLFLASPAHAFLNIDKLEQELETIDETEESGQSGLDALLQGLEDVKEDVEIENEVVTTTNVMSNSFNDVPSNAWFHKYVSFVSDRGIVGGYKDKTGKSTGRYGPGDAVTIAQMLKIAMEAAEIDRGSCKDSPRLAAARGHWASEYVACAEQMNMRIIQGDADINRAALRGEVLGIVHDAFGIRPPTMRAEFSDTSGHPYEKDIALAYVRGVVSGDDGKTTYRPNDGVNRAEAAKMVYQQLKQE